MEILRMYKVHPKEIINHMRKQLRFTIETITHCNILSLLYVKD